MRYFCTALLILMLSACAPSRGFDRGTLREQISDQKQLSESDTKNVLELKPQLPSSFRLAVYFTPPATAGRYGKSWGWLGEDKDTLLALASELNRKGIVTDIFVISDHIVEGSDNKAIRLAAARAGADAVLIVNGVCAVDRKNNTLAFSYFLLITTLVIPGTDADALFMAQASMWDVRNQYLYITAEGEGTAKDIKPVFFIDEKRIINAAKAAALTNLKAELSSRLSKMSAK